MNDHSIETIAYAAGLFDGEGSVCIPYPKSSYGGKRYHRLMVSLASTDPRVIMWLKEKFGGNISRLRIPLKPQHKLSLRWGCNSLVAEQFLRLIQPYLLIKAEQVAIAMAFRATTRNAHAGMVNGRHGTSKDPITPDIEAEREGFRQQLLVLNKRGVALA